MTRSGSTIGTSLPHYSMTFINTLTKDLSITDTNGFNKAVVSLMRHMKGLAPLVTCTSCGQEHDGTTALCLSCDDQLADAREDIEPQDETPDYCF